jgi:hypothetical protein
VITYCHLDVSGAWRPAVSRLVCLNRRMNGATPRSLSGVEEFAVSRSAGVASIVIFRSGKGVPFMVRSTYSKTTLPCSGVVHFTVAVPV